MGLGQRPRGVGANFMATTVTDVGGPFRVRARGAHLRYWPPLTTARRPPAAAPEGPRRRLMRPRRRPDSGESIFFSQKDQSSLASKDFQNSPKWCALPADRSAPAPGPAPVELEPDHLARWSARLGPTKRGRRAFGGLKGVFLLRTLDYLAHRANLARCPPHAPRNTRTFNAHVPARRPR